MDRRTFIAGGIAALSLVGRFAPAEALPARIGVLLFESPRPASAPLPFAPAFKELGWAEGRDFIIEVRYAGGKPEQLPILAQELVSLRIDVLMTGGTAATRAAKDATGTIPIVFIGVGDPVASGLVASLARPGGNVTGIATQHPDSERKRLDLMLELVTGARDVAFLYNPNNSAALLALKEVQAAANSRGITLRAVPMPDLSVLASSLQMLKSSRTRAVLVGIDPLFYSERGKITGALAHHGIPAVYGERDFVVSGGLASYGPRLSDAGRRAVRYVEKILKGAKPTELPVEQPTTFEFVVNAKAAKTLGLTIPSSLLARADQVIE